MNSTFLKRSGLARGFTLVEALVVIAIIAALVLMALPSMVTIIPNFEARRAAEATSSLMYMARMAAENTQKPIRAVVNCAVTGQPCRLTMYAAVFTYTDTPKKAVTLTGWNEIPNVARSVAQKVRVSPSSDSTPGAPANIYWVVFLPKGGVVASSPTPMNLVVQYGKRSSPAWVISVDKVSGRVDVRRK